jgi:hypothetical protein
LIPDLFNKFLENIIDSKSNNEPKIFFIIGFKLNDFLFFFKFIFKYEFSKNKSPDDQFFFIKFSLYNSRFLKKWLIQNFQVI